ncbi:MAG: TlpA disulfide reductase family protein [Flavisolibacter sp.]
MTGSLPKIFFIVVFTMAVTTARTQGVAEWKLADLEKAVDSASQPTVINFWATFCKPCIAEMPHFQKLAGKYKEKGLSLIFVSLDLPEAFPDRIRSFMKRLQVSSPVAFLNETNADEFCPVVDLSWSGAIPATLFIYPKTGYSKFLEQGLDEASLEKELQLLLQSVH